MSCSLNRPGAQLPHQLSGDKDAPPPKGLCQIKFQDRVRSGLHRPATCEVGLGPNAEGSRLCLMLRHYLLEMINIFEQGAPHVHFAPGFTNHAAVLCLLHGGSCCGGGGGGRSCPLCTTRYPPVLSHPSPWSPLSPERLPGRHLHSEPRHIHTGCQMPVGSRSPRPAWGGEDSDPLFSLLCFPVSEQGCLSAWGSRGLTKVLGKKSF